MFDVWLPAYKQHLKPFKHWFDTCKKNYIL